MSTLIEDKTLICTEPFLQSISEDPFLTSQDRVRKWLHESTELKLPTNSETGSFFNSRVLKFLSEEDAVLYPNKDGPFQFVSSQRCFGVLSCLPFKNKR
jgi:hypothetical protein